MATTEKNMQVTNKHTGKKYLVTPDDAAAIKGNPHTSKLYKVEDQVTLPEMSGKIKAGTSANTGDESKA